MELQRLGPRRVKLSKSRSGPLAAGLVWTFLFLLFSRGLIVEHPELVTNPARGLRNLSGDVTGILVFLLVTVILLPMAVSRLREAWYGGRFVFDGTERWVYRNGDRLAPFTALEKIRVRRVLVAEGGSEFVLSLVSRDGSTVLLHRQKGGEELVSEAAAGIADVVDVPVERKG